MSEYINRDDAINSLISLQNESDMPEDWHKGVSASLSNLYRVPGADVVDRDEGIKMGAELAAMHGSDATSQELEKVFFDGMEEGYKMGRSGFEKRGQWVKRHDEICYWVVCSGCEMRLPRDEWGQEWRSPYCPNCGAKMED